MPRTTDYHGFRWFFMEMRIIRAKKKIIQFHFLTCYTTEILMVLSNLLVIYKKDAQSFLLNASPI